MEVKIMYRNNWFGGDGWTYYPVTITISDNCPICGEKRGVPRRNRYCEDETFYYLDNWKNSCGHIDYYKNVYLEANELLKIKEVNYGHQKNEKLSGYDMG